MPRYARPVLAIVLLCLLFIVAACNRGAEVPAAAATQTAASQVVVSTPRPTIAQPTPTFTVPAPPQPQSVLPAPLYFIGEAGQIRRMEADGLYVVQVTNEVQPITSFDVSPTDGRLAYVSGNSLIELRPDGTRIVKVEGEPVDAQDPADRILHAITNVRFSPDGAQIAFGRNGVNLIDVGESTSYVKIQPSSPVPDPDNPPDEQPRFYRPDAWAPDGAHLLMEVSYWPEAGGLALKTLEGNETTEIRSEEPDGVVCCQWAWGLDGIFGYVASNLTAYGAPGLARVEVADGVATTLLRGEPQGEPGPENPFRFFAAPHQVEHGSLLIFVGSQTEPDDDPGYVMSQIDFGDDGRVTDLVSLRADEYPLIGQVLWAPDGRGALLVNAREYGDGPFPLGQLVWLTASGSPPVELNAAGSQVRWGVPGLDAPVAQAPGTAESGETETGDVETETPETGTPAITATAVATETAGVAAAAAADFAIDPATDAAFEGVAVLPLTVDGEPRYWAAYTIGRRDFENERDHRLAIYEPDDADGWRQLAQSELSGGGDPTGDDAAPDYLIDGAAAQVSVTPDRMWIQLDGGVGAHSGVYQLYSFDGEALTLEASGFSASPGAGAVADLNGDGIGEVLLDATDYYVFCYACGVREVQEEVLRWDGDAFVPVELTRLPADAPAALRDLNDRVVDLATAGLWQEAVETLDAVDQATVDEVANETFRWNEIYIRHNAELRRQAIGDGDAGYPILGFIFYGDYDSAVDILRGYEPAELFSTESPLLVGTAAEGLAEVLGERIVSEVTPALALQPDNAAGRFLLGWGLWLQDPDATEAVDAVTQAAELAPDDALFAASRAYLAGAAADDDTTPETAPEPTAEPTAESTTESAAPTAAAGTGSGRILYSAQDVEDGTRNIYAVSLADGTVEKLVDNAVQPRLQPGGARLAFRSTRDDMLGVGGFDLNTGERLRFSFNTEDGYPSWNPAGDQLVFGSNRAGDRIWRVYRTWADGNDDVSVLTIGQDPDWHPAADRIVYKGCDDAGARCGLWTMTSDGAERQPLTQNPGDARPRWTPDGAAVFFMSDQRDGDWEVYRVDVASGDVQRITNHPGNDGLPAVSPDGNQVAFVSDRGGAWQIWRVATGGGAAQLVTPIDGELPNWLEEGLDWVP